MFFTATQEISVLHHREPMIAQAIVALQRRAYKVEADLLDFPDQPELIHIIACRIILLKLWCFGFYFFCVLGHFKIFFC